MKNISIDEFHEQWPNLKDNDLILDVRSPAEYNEGHIAGARNVTHEEVGSIAHELKEHDTVYVHCKMGGRAKLASQILSQSGLDNIVCVGTGACTAGQKWAGRWKNKVLPCPTPFSRKPAGGLLRPPVSPRPGWPLSTRLASCRPGESIRLNNVSSPKTGRFLRNHPLPHNTNRFDWTKRFNSIHW